MIPNHSHGSVGEKGGKRENHNLQETEKGSTVKKVEVIPQEPELQQDPGPASNHRGVSPGLRTNRKSRSRSLEEEWRRAEGHCQKRVDFQNTRAGPQTDPLHAELRMEP